MLIFGTKSYATVMVQRAGVVLTCCNQPGGKRLVKVVKKFTFFFIPTFPISKRYYAECGNCLKNYTVKKDKAEQMIEEGRIF